MSKLFYIVIVANAIIAEEVAVISDFLNFVTKSKFLMRSRSFSAGSLLGSWGNTVQLRIFGTDFRPVETRNFASLARFLGLTERYWVLGDELTCKGLF